MENRLHWIWLSLACIPGTETFKKLITKYGTAENIFALEEREIATVISKRASEYSQLINKNTKRAENILRFCIDKGVGIVTYSDKEYPSSLRRINNPPVLLYYRGKWPDFDNLFPISVVGTRRLSEYGRKNAFTVSRDLARAGATVVSGMAIGIDGVSLAGALSAGVPTVAVIGSGIDICYPSQHVYLAREIVKDGCVITEYPPATPPDSYNFPVRNRLISALSYATLVIEGRERSGALITARHAKSQGKHVFALPGNVGNQNSEVSNLLIKNGAHLFTSADDVISILEKDFPGRLNPHKLTVETVDITEHLMQYRVCCVCPSDEIFKPNRRRNVNNAAKYNNEMPSQPANEQTLADVRGVDKKTLSLYKKIPLCEDIDMNSLIDSEHTLKDVMQGMLKLEMMGFVTMLPGDRVKRKLK